MALKVKPHVPRSKWKTPESQRLFFDDVGKQLGVAHLDEWYKIRLPDVTSKGGAGLLALYQDSLGSALQTVYPQHDWMLWKFDAVPRRYWNIDANRRKYFDWLGQELNIKTLDDWYHVPASKFKEHRGGSILFHRYNSMWSAMVDIYPEHDWLPWKFTKSPRNWFQDFKWQRKYLEWLSQQLNIQTLEQWYNVRADDFKTHRGVSLLEYYKFSLYDLLVAAYPEHSAFWKPWKFGKVSRSFWEEPSNYAKLVQSLSEVFSISTMDDWYRVSQEQLLAADASCILGRFGSLFNFLKHCYPNYPWDESRANSTTKRSTQRWLKVVVAKLFPGHEIIEDFMHPNVVYKMHSGEHETRPLQLDLYLPSLNLAFEYHGQQHYADLPYFFPKQEYQVRDQHKRITCKQNGIMLMEVPFWWDRKPQSLVGSLLQEAPVVASQINTESLGWQTSTESLVKLNSLPTIPEQYSRTVKGSMIPITEVHYQIPSGPSTTISIFNQAVDPTGYLTCSKYSHGVRAFWNGSKLLSKSGRPLNVPQDILHTFPQGFELDGELTIRGGQAQDLLKVIRSKSYKSWLQIVFHVFDLPNLGNQPLSMRVAQLSKLRETTTVPFLEFAEYTECKSVDHLNQLLAESGKKYEGLLFRDPKSLYVRPTTKYEPGFDNQIVKLKMIQTSVVKYLRTTVGGLLCEQESGRTCVVKCDKDITKKLPPPGSSITVFHSGLWNSGILKYPFFKC